MQGGFGDVLRLNPIALMIDAGRKALLKGEIAHINGFVIFFIITLVIYISGGFYFKKNIKRIAEFF